MQRHALIFAMIIFSLFSCGNNGSNKSESSEKIIPVDSDKGDVKPVEVDSQTRSNMIRSSEKFPVDTNGNSARAEKMMKVKIEIKTFRNTDIGGYGYEIIIDGHPYVHQPNIPAVPGNEGFESEMKAKKVAELVVFKIRNNIMPPTVSVRELDSLSAK